MSRSGSFKLPLVLLTVTLLAPLATRAAADDLRAKLGEVIDAPEYSTAHWGLLVVDLASGEVVQDINGGQLFSPASTTKLYSVAAALDAFGPDYRFETRVVRRGDVSGEGTLKGDLILIASGDLTMGGRTTSSGEIAFENTDHTYANGSNDGELTEPDPLAGLDEIARQVKAAGIKRIDGDVLIDDRLFDRELGTGSGPSTLTPIMINDNLIDVTVSPATAGKPATIQWRPQTAGYTVESLVETIEAGKPTKLAVSSLGPGRIVVRGQIAADSKPVLRTQEVDDAASFARTLLIEALRRAGVEVTAAALGTNDASHLPPVAGETAMPEVAKLVSPPFSESARLILKVSHNLHASTLPILLAVKDGKRSLEGGMRRQHDFLERVGVDVKTISFGSGAGGSRGDWITPRATVQLLRAMASRPDYEIYLRAMPILGVDGTLAQSVDANSPARGKVQAKTGTYYWENLLDGRLVLISKALGGYMTANSGRKLAFALFVNNAHLDKPDDTKRVGRSLGRICEILHGAL